MSWLSRIQNIPLTIITGDGKEYNPIFRNAADSTPTNESVFEPIEKIGGIVLRGELGVKQYNVELHFTGDDNIDTVIEFEESTKDTRAWTLIHPFYDEVSVQPSIINFNRSNLNDIVLSTTLYETLQDLFPVDEIDVQTDVETSVEEAATIAEENNISTDAVQTQNLIQKFKAAATTDEDLQNVINEGNNALNNLNDATLFMRYTANLLRTPTRFYASIKDRVRVIKETFTDLTNALTITATLNQKNYYENSAGINLSALAEASVYTFEDVANEQDLPFSDIDYETRNDVINIITEISDSTITFLNTIGSAQSSTYLPSDDYIRSILNTVNKATGQLFILAQNALQERNYVLIEDMTIITLHHRLYGNTDNIEKFMDYNNLGIEELLIVPKGTEVIYFV